MPRVQVSDEKGEPLTKVKVGDTKLQALQRLGVRAEILSDKDGLALLDDDCIAADGEPYEWKPPPQNTEEESAWEVAAAAADEGRGIILLGVDTDSQPDLRGFRGHRHRSKMSFACIHPTPSSTTVAAGE